MLTLEVRLVERASPAPLAVPVLADVGEGRSGGSGRGRLAVDASALPRPVAEVADVFLDDVQHAGPAGTVHVLPRPGHEVSRVLFVGAGDGTSADWRAAGAAVARSAEDVPAAAVLLPSEPSPDVVGAFTEGLLLGAYRYRLSTTPDERRRLETVELVVPRPERYADAHRNAVVTAEATCFARDLTNAPAADMYPETLAEALVGGAAGHGVATRVWEPDELAEHGFGGILAVGGGSSRGPRFVELRWAPREATRHVVLVGKGITFDTGGISLKPTDNMLLMRKDMAGAATVAAAVIGAARLNLPVRVTALTPLAENMPGADSYRPGDVVRHYGGITSEVLNTDAEGRMVLADALAYAVRHLAPDVVLDLATLTGAARVALGKRTAALFADDDALAAQLTTAADEAGERVWRLPLPEDYRPLLDSDIADLNNAPGMKDGAGAVTAAMFLREFLGDARDRWAHVDMSATSWADAADKELAKYATGWGVRTLLRWLATPT